MDGKSLLQPAVWILVPLNIAILSFICSVGNPAYFIDWAYLWLLFRSISPYFWAVIGIALCVGTSILGAAW
jgi:hypothetical protein